MHLLELMGRQHECHFDVLEGLQKDRGGHSADHAIETLFINYRHLFKYAKLPFHIF